jgi:hypothetical protein
MVEIAGIDRQNFEEYLKKGHGENLSRTLLRSAKEHQDVLESGDASVLLQLSENRRMLVTKSLANLAKSQGHYDDWRSIMERYGLRWTIAEDAELAYFKEISNAEKGYDSMVKWLRDTCKAIPPSYANVLIYATRTVLRASDGVTVVDSGK